MTRKMSLLALWVAGGFLSACADKEAPTTPADLQLRRLADCDELRESLVMQVSWLLANNNGWYGFPEAGVDDSMADGAPSGNASGPTDFTTTNNQEAGVDEIDLVKTNGTHLFIAQDRRLQIVKSWPTEDLENIASLDLAGYASGLFLVGDSTLVVLVSIDGTAFGAPARSQYGYRDMTRALTIDVSDPTAPKVTRTTDVDGYLVSARMVGKDVFFVLGQWTDLPDEVWTIANDSSLPQVDYSKDAATREAQLAAREQAIRPLVRTALQTYDVTKILPQWRDGSTSPLQPLEACSDVYVPGPNAQLSMTSVARFDPATGALYGTGLMSDGWTIYASTENLYVAQSSRWWWDWRNPPQSTIHKFALHTGQQPAYVATGVIDGWIYDQYAMSEYKDHLRVVTSDFTWWMGGVADSADAPVASDGSTGSNESSPTDASDTGTADESTPSALPGNNVFVLDDAGDGTLDIVGHVGGIAPGETIQAARLMGDQGYMVTFRQTDPLFTLDLSDPTAPRVMGELKMPGYSAYLHPLDDTHLIGVGMAGLETGQLTGLSVSLFDISDLTNPTLVDQAEVSSDGGWAWSEALWDPHAFTFHRDILTIPATSQAYDAATDTWSGFSGTISFRITAADGVEEIGRTDHEDLVDDSLCLYDVLWGNGANSSPGWQSYCSWDYGYWYASVRRTVYIEDTLLTISNYGVKASPLTDPSTTLTRALFYPKP